MGISGADTQTSVSLGQQASLLPLRGQTSVGAAVAAAAVDAAGGSTGGVGSRIPVPVPGLEINRPDGLLNTGANLLDGANENLPGQSLQAAFSRGGALIQALFASLPMAAAQPVRQPVPLLAAQSRDSAPTPPPTHQIAQMLSAEVEHSGLFYESHLVAFLNGRRSVSELMQEPQMQLSLPAGADLSDPQTRAELIGRMIRIQLSPSVNVLTQGALASALVSAAQEDPHLMGSVFESEPLPDPATTLTQDGLPQESSQSGLRPSPQAVSQRNEVETAYGAAFAFTRRDPLRNTALAERLASEVLQNQGDAPSGTDFTGARLAQAAIHPAAEAIVRQQLELLASQTWRWQGELAPGQEMHWTVTRGPGEEADNQKNRRHGMAPDTVGDNRVWTSRILLRLPHLGNVAINLQLDGVNLHAAINAEETDVVTILNQHADPLRQRLRAQVDGEAMVSVASMPRNGPIVR